MLDKEISNLIAYAETQLFLDELDAPRATRRICKLLGITEFAPEAPDEELIDAQSTPDALLAPLLEYAKANGKAIATRGEIMDALCLKPSEVNDLFFDTYSVNQQKAFDFLYDYNVKCGYIDQNADKSERWEAKELKSRIEVIINLLPQAQVANYPKCPLCKENIGFDGHENMRPVSLDLGGEEWFFNYSRHRYFERHGVLSNGEHTPLTDGISTIKKLALAADFIGADGFVGMNAIVENGGAKITAHEHFQTGAKSTPMLRAGYRARFKSKEYPYLELGVVDWYGTVIRFSHSNLEKTVEFADKLVKAWKSYSDDNIDNKDGKKNFCNIIVRKIADKYVFDVVLRSNGMKKRRTPAEYDEIKSDALSVTDVMGYFVLPTKLSGQLKEVQTYLDGTNVFDAANVPANIKPFTKMIERMLKEQGGTVSKLEAKLNLHDEIDIACEKILASTAVFDASGISAFFDSLDIRAL